MSELINDKKVAYILDSISQKKNIRLNLHGIIGYGHTAFVLCGTTLNSTSDDAKKTFGYDTGFSIENLEGFI